MSADATSTNLKEWAQYEEYGKIASFFVSLTGSPEEANTLLQRVVDALPVSNYANSRKRSAPSPSVPSASSSEHSFLVGDALDRTIITCLIQIPNDHAVIGAIIGPQGKHIKQMTESTGCLVNLDQKSQSAKSRTAPVTVFLQGPLRAVIQVAERVSLKVESVTKESSNSSNWAGTGSGANRTIMIIPDLLVKRVIGRGGTSVTKLQKDSGAAIQLQNEAKMMTSPDPLFGREALITGSLPARLHGLYLICRMMLEDGDCPAAWKTAQLFPTPIRGISGGGMVMTAKGVFGQGAPPPPQPQHGQGQQQGYAPQQFQQQALQQQQLQQQHQQLQQQPSQHQQQQQLQLQQQQLALQLQRTPYLAQQSVQSSLSGAAGYPHLQQQPIQPPHPSQGQMGGRPQAMTQMQQQQQYTYQHKK